MAVATAAAVAAVGAEPEEGGPRRRRRIDPEGSDPPPLPDTPVEVGAAGTVAAPMAQLLQDAYFSDLIFVAGPSEEEIPAHRVVLMAHSEVLRAMLHCDCLESRLSRIPLPEFPPDTVRRFLALCYTGVLTAPAAALPLVLQLCHLYQMGPLVAALGEAIAKHVTDATALQLFSFGCTYEAGLKRAALAHLRQAPLACLHAARDRGALPGIPASHLHEVMADDEFVAPEEDILRFIVDWGRAAQIDGQPPLPTVLAPLMNAVRWQLLPSAVTLEAWRDGIAPADVVLPSLIDPTAAQPLRCNRSGGAFLPFALKCAYSPAHHVYLLYRPMQDAIVETPKFMVGGIEFRIKSTREEGWFSLSLLRSDPPATPHTPLVCSKVAGLNTDGTRWVQRRFSRPLTSLGWNWMRLAMQSSCYDQFSRLFGPKQDHLLFEVAVQVEGHCNFERLAKLGPKEFVEFTLPAIVFELDYTHRFQLCDVHWILKICTRPSETTTRLFLSSEPQPQDDTTACTFEFVSSFRHPTDSTLSSQSTRKVLLYRDPSGQHTGVTSYTWAGWASQASFAWASQEVVLRCSLERLPSHPNQDLDEDGPIPLSQH